MRKIFAIIGITLIASVAHADTAIDSKPLPAQRIVASGGSITEVIYALGEAHRLVGVDSTSVFPNHAKSLPQIGYVRSLSPEGVLSLNPDLLIGEADTGPEKVVEQLKATGLEMDILKNHDSLFDIENKVRIIAKKLNAEAKGERLIETIAKARAKREVLLAQVTTKPTVLFVLGMRSGQPIVAGKDTSAHEVIEAAGGLNIAGDAFTGWKPLSPEAAVAMAPDVILGMARHSEDEKIDLTKLSHFAMSPAVQNNRVFLFEGSYLLGMGPRTPTAVVELIEAIHPQFATTATATTRHLE